MNINGVNGNGSHLPQTGVGQAEDAQSRNIRKQIEDARKSLQEVVTNGDLSPEEKMKKRQEIQKQISDLRMQLRQHQTELRKEQREEKRAAENRQRMTGAPGKAEEQGTGLSAAGMEAVISSESSMKQAKVQNGVAVKMEGRTGVLEAEIKQDGRSGADTSAKEAELAGAKQKAEEAAASSVKTLKEANQKLREESGTSQTDRTKEKDPETEKEKDRTEQTDKDGVQEEENTRKEPGSYVDVRL